MNLELPTATLELRALKQRMSRRVFLSMAGKGALALAVAGSMPACALRGTRASSEIFTPFEADTLSAVQEHMLPSEPGSPGARDINAMNYLRAAVLGSDIDPEDIPRLKRGCKELSDRIGGKPFASLTADEKERLLRDIEEDPEGEAWLTLVMGFLLEAYVGDPAYGGNPGGMVWAWLGHWPGFPRPEIITAENRR